VSGRQGWAAALACLSVVSLVTVVSPAAHASVGGLELTIRSYDWVPRTGNVVVTARAECPRRVWSAYWQIELDQRGTKARSREDLRCDGDPHVVTLTLDPRHGRFHPGDASLQLLTMECVSDVCMGLIYPEREIRIPPPGHARDQRP
jgi:hypothetical protein